MTCVCRLVRGFHASVKGQSPGRGGGAATVRAREFPGGGGGAVTCTGEGVCFRCWNHVGKEGPSLRPTLPVGMWPAPELSPQASLEEKKNVPAKHL